MKAILGQIFKGVLGKEVGAIPGVFGAAMKQARGSAFSKSIAHNNWNAIKMNLIMGSIPTLLLPGSPEEKMQNLAFNIGAGFLTMGMSSPWRQFGWSALLSIAPHFASMTRGIVQGYRGTLESRTSLSIPFSHSTLAMDQAFATLQYSRQRMSDAYQNVGSEAMYYAARYTSRG